MDFVGGGGSGGGGGVGSSMATAGGSLGSDNGPILYSEPNRTSAIDDIRSVVIYIFVVTILVSFFLILPGIRYEKFPTFLCIGTSIIVTSIILIALFGTSWHVGEAPISAAYKAFSRDRIQGELSVRIGFQSVNITLRAHKYYILHATHGPIIMDNTPLPAAASEPGKPPPSPISSHSATAASDSTGSASSFVANEASGSGNLADELLGGETSDGSSVDTELEVEEVFAKSSMATPNSRRIRSSNVTNSSNSDDQISQIRKRSTSPNRSNSRTFDNNLTRRHSQSLRRRTEDGETIVVSNGQRYTSKRVNVDINYNERFYWIEPNQMRQEYQNALARGLPYPILTVVEYLSQDEAGFSWSRQYRSAGYYSYIILWLSLCVCALMFFLHCAAPKYGIYTMQVLGCLLLFTNLTYAVLVPRGEQKLVIPFEVQSLHFEFGWNFWLVLFGGGLSLTVGTLIVIVDSLFPNFIFTTILDVDFDSHNKYYKHRRKRHEQKRQDQNALIDRPSKPPFLNHLDRSSTSSSSDATKSSSSASKEFSSSHSNETSSVGSFDVPDRQLAISRKHRNLPKAIGYERDGGRKGAESRLSELFLEPTNKRPAASGEADADDGGQGSSAADEPPASDSEIPQPLEAPHKRPQRGPSFGGGPQHHSPVTTDSNNSGSVRRHQHQQRHHYESQRQGIDKNGYNLKRTDHLSRDNAEVGDDSHQVRL